MECSPENVKVYQFVNQFATKTGNCYAEVGRRAGERTLTFS
jgi:hypothetical protein